MRVLAGILMLALSGCAHHIARLEPLGSAARVAGNPLAGEGDWAGVHIVAEPLKWEGVPANLGQLITPVHVDIANHSGRPLRIRYRNFVLDTAWSARYPALPIVQVLRAGAENRPVPPLLPRFSHVNFFVVPYYEPYYAAGSLPLGTLPRSWKANDYANSYLLWPAALPSRDVQERGIPEGVLTDGGRLSGYFFYQAVDWNGPRLTFDATLVEAGAPHNEAGAPRVFGRLRIPFALR